MNNTTKYLALLLCLLLPTQQLIAEDATTHITTSSINEIAYQPEHSAPATTLSLNDSRISAETTGRISRIPVRVGDTIEKGALLIELICTDNRLRLRQASAAVTRANAQVTLAERQKKRTNSLRKDRNISEELFNQREADLKTARADLTSRLAAKEEAEVAVGRCRTTAPFGGIILERLAGEGEWVSPGEPLIRLLDNRRLEISAQIPSDRINSLKKAKSLTFESNRQQFSLQLRRLLPVVESRGRYREARLVFTADKALPGSSGRLLWQAPTPHLPPDLLLQRNGRLGLFLAVDGTAHFHPLPDAQEGQPAAVTLPPSSRLIIDGRQGLNDGDQVQEKN
ncbi:MAG: efflux RND transporter periplasmic adaptor subunit [Sedimenticola sp.]